MTRSACGEFLSGLVAKFVETNKVLNCPTRVGSFHERPFLLTNSAARAEGKFLDLMLFVGKYAV